MTSACFKPTPRQETAMALMGSDARHVLLRGGSRSGKTFVLVRGIVFRAMTAPKSRHAVLRYRFNHVKASVILDTFPKVMATCFPEIDYSIDKTSWYAKLPNDSEIWFGGLDDKERTEKILGQEYATILFNECSQIPYTSRNMAITRLAQACEYKVDGKTGQLRLKAFYDCNPPPKSHWLYKVFELKRDPDSNEQLPFAEQYASMLMNPSDNAANLPAEYIQGLQALPARLRARFLEGLYGEITEGALFTLENIDTYRVMGEMPAMVRIVIAVDPSGAGDEDNASNDEIGIIVMGLGVDGNGYVLEDITCKAGPSTWGRLVGSSFDRHQADIVVGESNYGGAMVEHVVQTARPRTPFRLVTASRGKHVRAEPVSSLYETGRIRHASSFPKLEDELCAFTTYGYKGSGSPNRADAVVWAAYELFPELTRKAKAVDEKPVIEIMRGSDDRESSWMAA